MNKLIELFNQKKGELNSLNSNLEKTKKEKIQNKKDMIRSERAQVIIQEVARKTQEKIKFHIEDVVGLAISTIFGDEYNFELDFIVKRNKTECDMFLIDKEENRFNPIDDNGGGVVDLVSFALRISLWNLQRGKKNNTIILDETFKHLSKDNIDNVSLLMKELSAKLNIQFILVTHIPEFSEIADKVFEVKKIKRESKIFEI
ncbi:MAG: hypothetical protein ACFFG0_47380 [Candidatus Thorarchaeota archaeon]